MNKDILRKIKIMRREREERKGRRQREWIKKKIK
jgi:hypothetical protein